MKAHLWHIVSLILGVVTVAIAVAPLMMPPATVPISIHHIGHAVVIALGVATALLATVGDRPCAARPTALWIAPVVAAPMIAMYLMWPSMFEYLDAHPSSHALDHLALGALGFATAYAGERYGRGIGWTMGILLECMALAAAGFFGVSPGGGS